MITLGTVVSVLAICICVSIGVWK